MSGPSELSRREREVLDSLPANLSNKESASKLYISERTVKFHLSNLLSEFGVRRRAELILMGPAWRALNLRQLSIFPRSNVVPVEEESQRAGAGCEP